MKIIDTNPGTYSRLHRRFDNNCLLSDIDYLYLDKHSIFGNPGYYKKTLFIELEHPSTYLVSYVSYECENKKEAIEILKNEGKRYLDTGYFNFLLFSNRKENKNFIDNYNTKISFILVYPGIKFEQKNIMELNNYFSSLRNTSPYGNGKCTPEHTHKRDIIDMSGWDCPVMLEFKKSGCDIKNWQLDGLKKYSNILNVPFYLINYNKYNHKLYDILPSNNLSIQNNDLKNKLKDFLGE